MLLVARRLSHQMLLPAGHFAANRPIPALGKRARGRHPVAQAGEKGIHMRRTKWLAVLLGASLLVPPALSQTAPPATDARAEPILAVESFTLPNGLRVVFHIDRSDPVVAVALAAHVGSGREEPGRTGFAHMFEHLFFLDSENLGPGGLDRLSTRVGGEGANGYTNRDQTIYLQTVPSDALEKMLWAEADKLGYFIGTVTDPVLAKEKQVVKNEKRQRVDNQPYGHSPAVAFEAVYPKGHPYSWTTIGSLADLDAATLDDVKRFHARYYVPNNATLVLAGDFDPTQARRWIEKYFGDIPRGPAVEDPKPWPAKLTRSPNLLHEDNFATLPQYTQLWPTVPAFHPDAPALWVLLSVLSDGPDGPLYRRLVDELKLTDDIDSFSNDSRIAGEIGISLRAFDGVDLDRVAQGMKEGFAAFEKAGVDPAALTRAKAGLEVRWYAENASLTDKAGTIARYDGFLHKPDFAATELARLRGVTAEDVMRVYRTYIAGKPRFESSFVPKGKLALAVEGAVPAKIEEEKIVQGAEAAIDPTAGRNAPRTKTASSFDRSVEPPFGQPPVLKAPTPWTAAFDNGLALSGIVDRELPVARFEIAIPGGRLRDDPARPGAANLVAEMLTRGTKKRSRIEFENALKQLGATVEVTAGDEKLLVSGSTLSRNFAATMALVTEMLLEPRWEPAELALAKASTVAAIQADKANPEAIAERVFAHAAYPAGNVLAGDPRGTEASVAALTGAELAKWHAAYVAPDAARARVVGAVDPAEARAALAALGSAWKPVPQAPLPAASFAAPAKTTVYFRDVPGAKQSVLLFAQPGPRRADPDYYAATASNFLLGGGGFASRLTQQVREAKGYTYGVRTRFEGWGSGGRFTVLSPVRTNVTLEAATLIRDIVRDYGKSFTADDLALTRTAMAKGRARSFETLEAKLAMLGAIGDYGLPADYVAREGAVLEGLTLEQVRTLAAQRIDTDRMILVVVGDAASQAKRLEALGYPVVMVKE